MEVSFNRREFLTAAGGAPALLGAAASARPNVILLLTDDQGYGDLSCHGNPVLKTPAMDRLHSESLRFTSFHSAPMCTPTRGQLLTGLDACRNGATSVTAGRALVRRGIPMMPEIFAGSGYATGLFGKWHVGDAYPYRPMDRGFQEAKYFKGFGLSSAPEFGNDYFNGRYQDNGKPARWEGYCTDFWFSQAMDWMGRQQAKKQPFFTYLPTNTPHGPAWVDRKYSAPYDRPGVPANFFGMISNLDENIARLEQWLTRSGLRENTILIFMTDNGATAGFNLFNAGMRGRKTMNYEGGHRVPCFVRWPAGGLRVAEDIAEPAQMQDMLPTLMDLCGLKRPAGARFDGASLAPLMKSKSARLADRKMVVQYGQTPKKWDGCVIWGKWRLVGEGELYDMERDFGQTTNAASANPEVLKAMRDHYEQWWSGVEKLVADFAPLSVGSDAENPVTLTCSDWQDIYCDNVNNVLDGIGGPRGGPWKVSVEKSGEYEIELSRWPLERNLALTAACPEKQMTVAKLPAGKAFPIGGAQLRIGGRALSVKTRPDDQRAVFRLKLEAGPKTDLHAWFQDAQGTDVCGAFFARVRRV
ncbi:MAG: arylsulfatase [Acidobacteria bacterium]|nr:arylsulfatase [Acidobacteriota bacterium]